MKKKKTDKEIEYMIRGMVNYMAFNYVLGELIKTKEFQEGWKVLGNLGKSKL
jgi:hypothetical protein